MQTKVKRWPLGRTNHGEKGATNRFHALGYLNNVDVTKKVLQLVNNATKELKTCRREMTEIKGQFISKTALYRLAGNSIVVSCLYHIFRTLLLPNQPENKPAPVFQPTLF